MLFECLFEFDRRGGKPFKLVAPLVAVINMHWSLDNDTAGLFVWKLTPIQLFPDFCFDSFPVLEQFPKQLFRQNIMTWAVKSANTEPFLMF